MKIVRCFTTSGIVLLLAVSGGANAQQDKDIGQERRGGWESSEITRNRQSRDEDNVRGRARAEERRGFRDTPREPGSASGEINNDKQTRTDQEAQEAGRTTERHEPKGHHEAAAKTQAKPRIQSKAKAKAKTKKARKTPRK
ncbi:MULTISPECIES: hypothetical protein [Methylomicrobium]|uniref:Secreted protein n=1 Tax=Methylomicrobium album BG8 TaxID=686340 RepID=H8GJZ1_METAL|nr:MULTISPECIES: hypothetical protein [Methylomicrobium]EIC27950.1 hypothetical protein Metal_0081 [Methylomicrobium album BG8]